MKVLKVENSSYIYDVFSIHSIYAFSMLSLGCILISELLVTDLFLHSISGMIRVAAIFHTEEDITFVRVHVYR